MWLVALYCSSFSDLAYVNWTKGIHIASTEVLEAFLSFLKLHLVVEARGFAYRLKQGEMLNARDHIVIFKKGWG